MDMMNFYFTAGVTSGNASRDFSHDISQTFFREILERKLKSPNLIISDSHAIGRHLSSFYKSGPKQIKTDISGIIIPVCHGDVSDYFHIAVSIPGDFDRDLRAIWKKHDIIEEHPQDLAILKKRGELTEEFMKKVFPIPFFGAYQHIPGYRYVPQIAKEDDRPLDNRLHYAEEAFEKWVDDNFVKN